MFGNEAIIMNVCLKQFGGNVKISTAIQDRLLKILVMIHFTNEYLVYNIWSVGHAKRELYKSLYIKVSRLYVLSF